jgi:hypothetical protein
MLRLPEQHGREFIVAELAANPKSEFELSPEFLEFREIVDNLMMSRGDFFAQFADPRRDYEKECGHPKGFIPVEMYQEQYDRNSIAARVVQVYPKETWQVQPTVFEKESPKIDTPFEKAWHTLGRQLQANGVEQNFFQDEKGSEVWETLKRADELSGIGRFGIILLGINDNKSLAEPVVPSAKNRLLFMNVFPEVLVKINKTDSDKNSPRYGQPIEYQVSFNSPGYSGTGEGLNQTTEEVHWTRVIHVADNILSSKVFGVPRMQQVLNNLLDLKKLYGGSAEMYWRGAFPGLSFETHPGLGGDAKVDFAKIKGSVEDFMNGLQRYMALVGMSAKSLAPAVVDPTPQIMVQIQAICIMLGIPMRVFMGSERGQLASGQDDAAWNDRLRERQHNHVTPRIIVPFVNRLIWLMILPRPEGFSVSWPELTSQTPQEKAQVSFSRSQAMAQYINSGSDELMSPQDFLVSIIGFSEEEAKSMVTNAKAWLKEKLADGSPHVKNAQLRNPPRQQANLRRDPGSPNAGGIPGSNSPNGGAK